MMRALTRYVPRKYRTTVLRVALATTAFIGLCLLMSGDQSLTGTGREDESLFRFDYEENGDLGLDETKFLYGGDDDSQQAVAPAQHRAENAEKLAGKEAGSNFTLEPLLDPKVYEYFNDEELRPWFEKPAPNPAGAGEYGKAFRVAASNDEISRKVKQGWEKHAFNHYACDQISLHRHIQDNRDKECRERRWRKPIPTTSVIIIFHNEAWCALLRTVHSVLETSPKVALKEIILVDDASTFDDLKKQLDDYVKDLQIVNIIRLPERAGLIRARLAGAGAAEGDVLTFLDSHCECAPNWLEPLLERIAEDPTRVVCPVIEVIDADTFAMSLTPARHVPIGAFGWGLEFRWATQPGNKGMEIQKRKRDETFTTPVMAGAAFTIKKDYFNDIGLYDLAMDGIGSENIELSFRVWICGGSVEINPCSRVGHIGRKRKPHQRGGEEDAVIRNKMTIAETWMDQYKWMFYRRSPRARQLEIPDVSERKAFLEGMGCGNFEWFMTEVYPDLYIVPYKEIILHGEIRCSSNEVYCLESNNIHGNPGSVVDITKCRGTGKGQYYELTDEGEIRQNTISELCLTAHGCEVWTEKCRHPWHDVPESQKWILLPDGHIYHPQTNLCLTANIKKLSVTLLKCVKQGTSQLWKLGQQDGYEEDHSEDGALVGEILEAIIVPKRTNTTTAPNEKEAV
ncbi:polypeptide N-acetylgalactosaminyltransferase 4-like isoform X1 [Clavelina lepadiformis]|uniref:polypeptide N-acetylgalactosaminyltransferase 4-like isoform X1 n=1 Tax=Clavelina lepadiformis TaxID=159417 RepID=UPI0040436B26